MFPTLTSVSSLLLGMGILLCGSGMLGTLLGLSAAQAGLPSWLIGLVMSGFFLGFIIGSLLCPRLIRRVGHIRAFGALAAVSAIAALLHGLVFDPWVWWILRIFNGASRWWGSTWSSKAGSMNGLDTTGARSLPST